PAHPLRHRQDLELCLLAPAGPGGADGRDPRALPLLGPPQRRHRRHHRGRASLDTDHAALGPGPRTTGHAPADVRRRHRGRGIQHRPLHLRRPLLHLRRRRGADDVLARRLRPVGAARGGAVNARQLRERISSRRRGGWQPRVIFALAVVWVLLWDQVTLGNVVNGLIIGAVITQIFPLPSIQYFGRIHPWGLTVLLARFFYDLVSAAIEISVATLDRHPPRGG